MSDRKSKANKNVGKQEGARKAALLLSILDPEVANSLLKRFEPSVAVEIAKEAKRVDVSQITESDVEAIVEEFLESFGVYDPGMAEALLGEAKRTVSERQSRDAERLEDGANVADIDMSSFSALSIFEPETVARAIQGERPSTIAAVLLRLEPEQRDETLELLPEELAATVREVGAFFISERQGTLTSNATVKRLEDALCDRALEDEQ